MLPQRMRYFYFGIFTKPIMFSVDSQGAIKYIIITSLILFVASTVISESLYN